MPIVYQDAQRRHASMLQERQSWEPHWRELQEFFSPRRGRFAEQNPTSRGQKVNTKLIDPSPRVCLRILSAGLHSGSTNPSMPWMKLRTPDNEMMEFKPVSLWLSAVEQAMRDVFERSNLYSVLPAIYTDGGLFGTSPIMVLDHPTDVIHCVPSPVGTYCLGTDYYGNVVSKYCVYKMTVSQIIRDFGKDKVSMRVRAAFENNQLSEYFDILHVIEPNEGRQWDQWDAANMAWRSVYFEVGTNHEQPLRESGFEDNPLGALRWEVTENTDPYGASPGMDALGLSKSLQIQTKQKAKAIDKLVDPPMVGDPALEGKPSTLIPGGVTYAGFTATGSAPKFQPAYQIKPEVAALLEDIQDSREILQQVMYTDLFLAITMADPRNATVPEIVERREEKILMLGPVLQNHKKGLIQPIIDRTFYIMMRQGRLPPPPPELEGVDLKVEMIGMLAQALKAIQTSGIERFVGFVGAAAKAQADAGESPTALDKIDVDQSIDEYALAIGVPPTVVRSDDDVAATRDNRAKQQQAAAAAQAAQPIAQMAGAVKDLSETKVGGRSALDAVVEGQ
jgi:hypothetical protein